MTKRSILGYDVNNNERNNDMKTLTLLLALILSGCFGVIPTRETTIKYYGVQSDVDKVRKEFTDDFECPEGYSVTFRSEHTIHCRANQ